MHVQQELETHYLGITIKAVLLPDWSNVPLSSSVEKKHFRLTNRRLLL